MLPPQPRIASPKQAIQKPLLPVIEAEIEILPFTFWQHPFVQDILPFLTSLFLHICLIAVGLLTYKAVMDITNPTKVQAVIPIGDVTDEGVEGGIPHPGLGGDASRDAAQDKYMDVPANSKGIADKPGTALIPDLAGGAGNGEDEAVIGTGGRGIGRGGDENRVGRGTGNDTGILAPFGIPGGGGGVAPRSNFFKIDSGARLVCYVCDASGSMMTKFDSLRNELKKSTDNLKERQFFNVIFFQITESGGIGKNNRVPLSEGTLVSANAEWKRKCEDFLARVAPHGETDPIPALEIAFAQKPQLVYLLTDGDFPDNGKVVTWIAEHNKDKKIKIITIAYVDRGEQYEKVLKQIALENNGQFRYVSDADLGN